MPEKEVEEKPKVEKTDEEDPYILRMGGKPFQNYLMALNAMLIRGAKRITLRGRGKLMSRIIDLSEFGKRVHGLKCPIDSEHWKITSDKIPHRERPGKETYVTSLEIILERV